MHSDNTDITTSIAWKKEKSPKKKPRSFFRMGSRSFTSHDDINLLLKAQQATVLVVNIYNSLIHIALFFFKHRSSLVCPIRLWPTCTTRYSSISRRFGSVLLQPLVFEFLQVLSGATNKFWK